MAESLEEVSPAYSIETREICLITVLDKGKSFPYTIPSFPVFTVMLREAIQWVEDGTVEYFDGFMHECGLLEHLHVQMFIMGTRMLSLLRYYMHPHRYLPSHRHTASVVD